MIPFHRKCFGHRLNHSLNCLVGLWTFLHLKDVKISLPIIVLILRGCFDRTHGLNKLFFALDARALLIFNYDKPSRIFPCILLTRNHMIFLVQFGINNLVSLWFTRAYLFQIALEIMWLPIQIRRTVRVLSILLVFKFSCLFTPNWTLNHVISCRNIGW